MVETPFAPINRIKILEGVNKRLFTQCLEVCPILASCDKFSEFSAWEPRLRQDDKRQDHNELELSLTYLVSATSKQPEIIPSTLGACVYHTGSTGIGTSLSFGPK